jgi:hypothetical protein
MLTMNYLLCAESSALDQRRNTLCAFHILDNLYVPLFPFVIQRISILASAGRSTEEPSLIQARLVVTLGESKIFECPVALNFAQRSMMRTIIEIGGLLIPQPGRLKFAVFRETEEISSYSVPVERIQGPTVEQLPFPDQPKAID